MTKRMILLVVFMFASVATAGEKPVIHHDVHISFSIINNEVTYRDAMTIPVGIDSLSINRSFNSSFRKILDGEAHAQDFPDSFKGAAIKPREGLDKIPTTLNGYMPDEPFELVVDAWARLIESTDDVEFSRENVGREISATIGEEGIYLAVEGWLPFHPDAMNTYRLTIDTPAGYEPVTQGRRTQSSLDESGATLRTVWEAVHPSDGIILIANRYHVTERQFGDVASYTYFLQDEPKLVETYMERTGAYLEMYQEMIGPYPYAKFATVENWFPTGYGMPSWTLLGGTVLRLPFIPYTSFGHEICHNWWGNSAFVDDVRGNWCEGLTVYCADYHYKTIESPEAAREYRRNLLKDFAAYVRDGRDMPLREFRERHSGATRAIGYGKSMMVFHMVERMIGREAFVASLRDVWGGHPFAPVSWDDFMEAFEYHGGVDLGWYSYQWLDREGAPLLRLTEAERRGNAVHVVLEQEEPTWILDVPVTIETAAGAEEHVVRLNAARGEFTLPAPGAVAVAVDPDDHVFRRLHPEEVEATLSQVLGADAPRFVVGEGPLAEAGRAFAERWIEADDPDVTAPGDPAVDRMRILLNPDAAELERWLPESVRAVGGLLFLEGRRIDLKTNDAVLALGDPDVENRTGLVVLCRDAGRLEALADRLSHYGKYSWLVFPARGRPQRGNWTPASTPLRTVLQ